MNIKNRFIKVRFAPEEYSDITRKADKLGMNRCDYIRNQLQTVHQQIDIRSELHDLRALAVAQSEAASQLHLEALTESVLMLRELLASRDPQAIARVKAQLRQQFGNGGGQ